jgi:hypothetical protein
MAQHDYIINNQTFPSYRTDHNNSLSAIASNNSGATEPSTTYAYQWWYDTSSNALKIRNADNDAWITIGTFDQATDSVTLTGTQVTFPTITSTSIFVEPDTNSAVTISGTNFISVPIVEAINDSTGQIYRAVAVTWTNSTTLSATFNIPNADYYVRVENNDGYAVRSSTAILSASSAPTWSTASGSIGSVSAGSSVSLSVSATSDSTVSYSETTSVLTSNADTPASTMNLSLNSSTGAITGTAPEPTSDTTYNFTLRATDDESQTADRNFSITVSVGINNGGQFN